MKLFGCGESQIKYWVKIALHTVMSEADKDFWPINRLLEKKVYILSDDFPTWTVDCWPVIINIRQSWILSMIWYSNLSFPCHITVTYGRIGVTHVTDCPSHLTKRHTVTLGLIVPPIGLQSNTFRGDSGLKTHRGEQSIIL